MRRSEGTGRLAFHTAPPALEVLAVGVRTRGVGDCRAGLPQDVRWAQRREGDTRTPLKGCCPNPRPHPRTEGGGRCPTGPQRADCRSRWQPVPLEANCPQPPPTGPGHSLVGGWRPKKRLCTSNRPQFPAPSIHFVYYVNTFFSDVGWGLGGWVGARDALEGEEVPPPRPLQGAQPAPRYCFPDGKCHLQWRL